jgi:anaerobic selenocysteine-containing dehydrogenase
VSTTHYRTCPLCEATCGLEVKLDDGGQIASIRGDRDDVFSRGFICPKGASIKALHEDPARLRRPLVRSPGGDLVEASWDAAFERVDELLAPILEEHGRDAVAAYLGNPSAHSLGAALYGRTTLRALGSRNIYTASTVDQMPKHVSAGLMFGTALSVPVPDVDRCMHLLMLGANPLASNGSLMTAPDMRGRLRALRERGGKLVVIDPRRSRTAKEADEHHFIRPGTDAHLLAAIAQVLFDEGLASVDDSLVAGFDEAARAVAPFTPEAVAPVCGIAAGDIRRMAHELAAASPAAVYGRIGTTTQRFGSLASWLVDVLNAVTGNLDRPGGAMFPLAAAGQSNARGGRGGRGLPYDRWSSRVSGRHEVIGELPVSCLAEEIETPGDGQIRALITIAGNPARSTPNSDRLEAALDELDALVCIDLYVNETTRRADVILPAPPPFAKSHYDVALYQLAVRNVANWSAPIMEREDGMPDEWETLLRLAGILAGQGPHADIDALDDMTATAVAKQSGIALEDVAPRRGPARILDLMLRAGPYDLTLADLEASPHGVDLGPLQPRLPELLKTPSGMVELAPEPLVGDMERLRASLAEHRNGDMVLIGRRTLRSNNSWMHNLEPLVKGPPRCTMHVHPDDAARLGLLHGEPARVRSRAGEIEAPVEITDAVMPGVVSIPHGWGHGAPGAQLPVAARYAGVNANALTDELDLDPLSGNAVLNGVPVEVSPAPAVDSASAPAAVA